jgi:tetratricopeptide (TPR) repeat protein
LAYHFTKAGNKPKSIEYSLAAGKDALKRFSNAEAIKHFTYVLENTLAPDFLVERTDALEGLGSALVESGLQSQSIRVLEQLYDTAKSDLTRIRALRKAMWAATYQGDLATVQKLAAKAQDCPMVDRLEYARIRLYMATADTFGERRGDALANIELALKVFEEECSLTDVGEALIEAGIIYGKAGRLEESLSAGLRSQALLKDGNDLTKVLVYGHLSYDFLACGLLEQAIEIAAEGIKIGQRIDNPRMAWLYFFSATAHNLLGRLSEATGRASEAGQLLAAAIAQNLRGEQIAKKTDGYYILGAIYFGLSMGFLSVGNMQQAVDYQNRFLKLRDQFGVRIEQLLSDEGLSLSAAFHSAKDQWIEASESYKKLVSARGDSSNCTIFDALWQLSYAKSLFMQKNLPDAQRELMKGQAMMNEITSKFDHTNILLFLLAPSEITVGSEFLIRLDIINLSKAPAAIVRIEGLTASEFEITPLQIGVTTNRDTFNFEESKLGAFKVLPVQLRLRARTVGVFNLIPRVVFINDKGETQLSKSKPAVIHVSSPPLHVGLKDEPKPTQAIPEFKTEAAQRVFNFLLNSFREDYLRGKKLERDSGWRTLMDIVKQGKVSRYSVYGIPSSHGQAIAELEHAGLVEARIFSGERGRGGRILRVRVAYEKESVKLFVKKEN